MTKTKDKTHKIERKPKLLTKSQIAELAHISCPQCDRFTLGRVKGGEVFCSSCGCHISPRIFSRLAKG